MKEKLRLQDLNDVEEHKYIMKIIEKLKYSPKIYTEEEINKILNPYNQGYLTKITDFADKNKHVPLQKIVGILYKWGFITVFNNICYSRKPYTYNYIIPTVKNGKLVSFDEELVLTIKVEDKLQRYCNEQQ